MSHEIYLGLMSGTSLDAIDAVAACFDGALKLLGTHSLVLAPDIRTEIMNLTLPGENEIDRMGQLDHELGVLFAECANTLIQKSGIDRTDIKAIGSHGQTIRHRPALGSPFTLQIADPNLIAERCGITVVADFRRRDMAAGGQGAPLVPAFHQSIFQQHGQDKVILNLGWIANITLLPGDVKHYVRGYDTGPANMLMDAWCARHLGLPFDKDGRWASTGQIAPDLLAELLTHPYFASPAPKSTGREDFNIQWLMGKLRHFPILPPADVQATLVELTCISVSRCIAQEGFNEAEIWVCGGGAYNKHLMSRLAAWCKGSRIKSTDEIGLAPTWVEATAFAWLARQTINRLAGNIPAVTGAKSERILGGIYPA